MNISWLPSLANATDAHRCVSLTTFSAVQTLGQDRLRRSARNAVCRSLVGFGLLLTLARAVEGQQRPGVPVVDAKAGPCSVELTVTDIADKPVYAATIRVHISYGFIGLRKTDLEIGTNVNGKARFVGLPQDSDELLYFRAAKGRRIGRAVHSTAKECAAHQFIVLRRR